jgi:LacI family transcriptional regulator
MSDRPTLADVARLAGVSVPTVSKVIRGGTDVSATTRSRVQEAMRAAGYEFRDGFDRRTRGILDLVIDGLDSLWALQVIRGTEDAAAKFGLSVAVTSTGHGALGPTDWLRRIAARSTDGVVAALTHTGQRTTQQLRSLNAPLVLLDPIGEVDPEIPTVGASNWLGGLTAVEHFLAMGHTRIGIVTGPMDVACSQERLDGYLAAVGRAGLAVDRELIVHGDFLVEGGRRGAETLLDLPEPPTAIFACGDLAAAGVYQIASERQLRIPRDLSVIGFDDIPMCELLSPPLTTIRQPIVQMAAEAVRLVVEAQDRQRGQSAAHLQLRTSLIERASVGRR